MCIIWTGKTLNLTIPCLSIKIHASHVNFGLNHISLVNPLPISYSVVISGCTTVNTFHATKLMGIMASVWVTHYVIICKKLCGWGEEMLKNSFGKNNTMGPPLKGISPFAPKILKSTLFTALTQMLWQYLWEYGVQSIDILLFGDFLSSHFIAAWQWIGIVKRHYKIDHFWECKF